jgi:hypothetical protein
MLLESGVNTKFESFKDTFLLYFYMAFPLKLVQSREPPRNSWITQGIKISSKNMRFLSSLGKKATPMGILQVYISRYQTIYRRVIKEAKRRENDRYIFNAKNKTEAMWQVINRETGKTSHNNQQNELKYGTKQITDP